MLCWIDPHGGAFLFFLSRDMLAATIPISGVPRLEHFVRRGPPPSRAPPFPARRSSVLGAVIQPCLDGSILTAPYYSLSCEMAITTGRPSPLLRLAMSHDGARSSSHALLDRSSRRRLLIFFVARHARGHYSHLWSSPFGAFCSTGAAAKPRPPLPCPPLFRSGRRHPAVFGRVNSHGALLFFVVRHGHNHRPSLAVAAIGHVARRGAVIQPCFAGSILTAAPSYFFCRATCSRPLFPSLEFPVWSILFDGGRRQAAPPPSLPAALPFWAPSSSRVWTGQFSRRPIILCRATWP